MSVQDHKRKYADATLRLLAAEAQLESIRQRYRATAMLGRSTSNDVELSHLRDVAHTQLDFILDAISDQSHHTRMMIRLAGEE